MRASPSVFVEGPRLIQGATVARNLRALTGLLIVFLASPVSARDSHCPADLTGDGIVNGSDLGFVLGAWGPTPPAFPQADFNGDGIVDGDDLGTLLGGWGRCPIPVATTFVGTVVKKGAGPVASASLASNLGGSVLTDPLGQFELVLELYPGTTSLDLFASATIDGRLHEGNSSVRDLELGAVHDVGVIEISWECGGEFVWSGLNSDWIDQEVMALVPFDDGNGSALYVGGAFNSANMKRIAKWDGNAWSALGTGVTHTTASPTVRALAVFDEGSGSSLFAGGLFDAAGGSPATGVARWNGSAWSPLGPICPESCGLWNQFGFVHVSALAVYDDGTGPALFVGGTFTRAGMSTAINIAKWDGQTWSGLGSEWMNEGVLAMSVFDDGSGDALYVAGAFNYGAMKHIAKWDGLSWSPLGAGTDNYVRALGVYDDGTGAALFVGGHFATAGEIVVNGVAKWDGIAWSAVGEGVASGDVLAPFVGSMGVFDDGSGEALIAGGHFNTIDGVAAANIAKWDGIAWSPLSPGRGLSPLGKANAITNWNDGSGLSLFAAGGFGLQAEAGSEATNIAEWGCSKP